VKKHFYPDRDTFVTQSGYRFPIGNNAVFVVQLSFRTNFCHTTWTVVQVRIPVVDPRCQTGLS